MNAEKVELNVEKVELNAEQVELNGIEVEFCYQGAAITHISLAFNYINYDKPVPEWMKNAQTWMNHTPTLQH